MAADLPRRADKVPAGVLYERKRLRQDRIKRLALRDAVAELLRHPRKIFPGEVLRLVLRLDAVDFADDRPQFFQLSLVLCPE